MSKPLAPAAAPRLTLAALACARGGRTLFEIDLEIQPGQVVWLRGRNGRGKTTLLRIAAGLADGERGHATRRGHLLYIGHANALKDDLRVGEALEFLRRVHGHLPDGAAIAHALERLGLAGERHALVRTLSQGQRRRAALARLALDAEASLWLLDEPFDALDADGAARLNGLLAEHARRGGCVLLTSHQGLDAALAAVEVDLDRKAA